MRFNKLDLNLLVALDALLTESSISKAAIRVHLGQSAMSNALARLRDYFGDELLVQVGRKMELTPRALALKDPVRDVLIRVDATIATQPQFDPARSDRVFCLFVSDYSTAVLIPHLLALTYQQSRTVRFQLQAQVDNPQRSLERGEVDLMIIPSSYVSQDHPSAMLFEESFSCVVCAQSALAESELTLERYLATGHVVMQPPRGGNTHDARMLEAMGITRRVEVSTFSFATAARLVVGTSRIATLHTRLARQAQAALPVVARPTPMPIAPMQQHMQWHKYHTQDPGLMWLRGMVQEATRAMDATLTAATP